MAPSRTPSPLKIPQVARKLSLPSLRRKSPATSDGLFPRRSSAYPGSSTNGEGSEDYGAAPFPPFLKKSRAEIFATYVDLEWLQRDRLAAGAEPSSPPSQWLRTQGSGDPQIRNRYANVEPFESNRVKLKVAEGDNDYINASPIVLDNRRYISTQGPKASSVTHFYHMIATETSNKAVVVMLTQTHEAGREKCFKYWPSESNGANYEMPLRADSEDQTEGFEGFVSLVSKKEDSIAKCTVRRLKLRFRTRRTQDSEDPPWEQKDIWHLLFAGWPDFATPEGDDREALLELVNLSRRLNAFSPPPMRTSFPPAQLKDSSSVMIDEFNPRIVHCSAGVGRSGTFIAIDHLFTLLDAGRLDEVAPDVDPISDTVDQLRQQRMMMVQGETQFLFLYEVLREAWLARWFDKQQRLAVAEEEKASE